jgi:hypothetical protein
MLMEPKTTIMGARAGRDARLAPGPSAGQAAASRAALHGVNAAITAFDLP